MFSLSKCMQMFQWISRSHSIISYDLKRGCGSLICLCLFFSVGYLQVTTQTPITWKMAQWSQALTTSRYVFLFCFFLSHFLITFEAMNLFKIAPPTVITVVGLLFLKLLYCAGVRQKKSRFCTKTHFSILLEIVLCVRRRRFHRWAGTFSDSYLMK